MSKVFDNPLLSGASGKFANVFVYRRVRGEVVMAKKPTRTKPLTENQLAASANFQKAIRYGKRQVAKPESKLVYATGITPKKNSAYLVAITDFLNAPEILSVESSAYTGVPGQSILIAAEDDFRVNAVAVEIQSPAGVMIEQGAAVPPSDETDEWTYVSTAENAAFAGSKIIVTVRDLAGNKTVQTFDR